MKTILVTIAALSLSTAAVLAQDAAAPATPDYTAVDANADGSVTFDELIVALPDITQEQFTAADLDASGGLTAEEYAALAAA
jgi:hypothetical protein